MTDKREVSIKVQFEAGKLQIRASKEGSLTVEVANLRDRLDLLEGGKKMRKRASGSQKAKKRKLKNRENAKFEENLKNIVIQMSPPLSPLI